MQSSPPPLASGLFREQNSYDLIRLLLAALVVYSHSFHLGRYGKDPVEHAIHTQMVLGHLGVLGFFGLSGFLVTASLDRSSSPASFLKKRMARIFPGFWCCLAVCAFVFAPAIQMAQTGRLDGFAWSGEAGATGYVWRNALLVMWQPTVGGILDGLPTTEHGLNGSLWSLFPEFACYLALLALGWAGVLRGNRPLLALAALVLAAFHWTKVAAAGGVSWPLLPPFAFGFQTPFLVAFAVGACLYAWREHFQPTVAATVLIGFLLAYTLRRGGFLLAGPLLVPLFVVYVGALCRCHLHHDLSYGLYIYSFPVQQFLQAVWPQQSWLTFLLLSFVGSFACAAASWFLVERRFLRHRIAPAARS